MATFLKGVMFCLFLSLTTNVAADWTHFSENDHSIISVDWGTLRTVGPYRRVWILHAPKPPKPLSSGNNVVRSTALLIEHDCVERRYRRLAYRGYETADGRVVIDSESNDETTSWKYTPPGTLGAQAENAVCEAKISR